MPKKNIEIGKRNRISGRKFEAKVRQNLEDMGWIVSKWVNTIEQEKDGGIWKIVPAKPKFIFDLRIKRMVPWGIISGFPDFICFKKYGPEHYNVIGVEVKQDGYLDAKERAMCQWLIDRIFSKILIAKRGKKRGEIEYIDFKTKYGIQ
ncbi:MAG: hypothetical protein QXX55_00345 [Candidatus Pacearchaeota archaeon]